MTLHFVVTLKLKTVIKKNDSQLRRSEARSYRTLTLLRLHLNLNVSSSSGKNGLLRGSGSGSNTLLQTLYCTLTRTYKKQKKQCRFKKAVKLLFTLLLPCLTS